MVSVAETNLFDPAFKEIPPGPGLALLLGAQEHDQLDDFAIVEMARAARRLASWATSIEYEAVAELSARRKAQGERLGAWDSEIGEWVIDEIAAALTLSGGTAAREVVVAQQLAGPLPNTFRALADGRVDADKAKVIADGVRGVGAEIAQRVESRVLPAASRQTCAQLRSAVRAAVRDADPEAHAQRRRDAEAERRLELWDTDSGTCDLTGRDLPAAVATAAYNRINAIAQALKSDGDPRTIDQLRADVLIDLLRNQRPAPQCAPVPAQPEPEPDDGAAADDGLGEQAVATAIADTLDDQLTGLTDGIGHDGRRLGGRPVLIREAARRVKEALADLNSRWCVTVTNATGVIIQHGAGSYRVPAGMRRAVQLRDATCRFPGCRRQAVNCDVDHTLAHHKGGPTCPCNLAILCRRHHRLKQRPEWQIIQIWHGVLLWIAPTGHWYITGPDRQ